MKEWELAISTIRKAIKTLMAVVILHVAILPASLRV